MIIRYLRAAQVEARRARDALLPAVPETALQFEQRLARAVEQLERYPRSGKPIFGVARAIPLSPFPYLLVYREREGELLIVAVAHARRRPGYWQHRLPSEDS